ncbi:MAG: GNAT family N-acetyltransferase, partial [bacterium]
RWLIRRDMPEVLAIEAESFEFPWLEEDFIRCLRQRNAIGMVAEYDEQIVGFVIYDLAKSRIHVLNFAVAKKWQRRGIGSQMATKLIGKLTAQRRTCITAEILDTNPAIGFFLQHGFKKTQTLVLKHSDVAKGFEESRFCVRLAASSLVRKSSLMAFLPDATSVQATDRFLETLEGLREFFEKKGLQQELDTFKGMIKESALERLEQIPEEKIAGTVPVTGLTDESGTKFIKAGKIAISGLWKEEATEVKRALIAWLCQESFVSKKPLFVECDKGDLPLYHEFGFVRNGQVYEYNL